MCAAGNVGDREARKKAWEEQGGLVAQYLNRALNGDYEARAGEAEPADGRVVMTQLSQEVTALGT